MKKYILIISAVFCLSLTSCQKYFDINVDPNSPSEDKVTTSLIFPGIEMNLAASYGDYLRIVGGYFAQHYSQYFGTSNYLDYSQFTMSGTRNSGTYQQLFQKVLENSKIVYDKSMASKDYGTALASVVMRAFAYQALVDCYGGVPYSEALNPDNLTPKYDDGKAIYAGIIAELDAALNLVDGTEAICTNFLFPGEKADKWIEFANALKLRILMRESNVVDVKSQVADLLKDGKFPEEDIAFTGCWEKAAGKESPFYAEEFSTLGGSTQKNIIANIALVGTMQQAGYTDPRLALFFDTNKSGAYTGGVSGTNFSTTKTFKSDYWCQPVASYDMPVYLITVAETNFFIAEYEARYGTATAAETAFKEALDASFESAGVEDVDAATAAYLVKFPYDNANYGKCIGLAKWLALSGTNNFEAYCELRRMKNPTFGTISGTDIYNDTDDSSYNPDIYVPGTLYTPIKRDEKVGDNHLLQRWPYAESSSSRNPNTPTFEGPIVPVFWAK